MSRATVTLNSKQRREQAARWVWSAPDGTRITFQEAKGTDAQRRLMWDLLTDVARQVLWHGQRLSADDWKLIFMAGLNQELRLVPNLEGNGFVNLGRSSERLSVKEKSDLIDIILAFGAREGVTFFDGDKDGEAPNKASPVAA